MRSGRDCHEYGVARSRQTCCETCDQPSEHPNRAIVYRGTQCAELSNPGARRTKVSLFSCSTIITPRQCLVQYHSYEISVKRLTHCQRQNNVSPGVQATRRSGAAGKEKPARTDIPLGKPARAGECWQSAEATCPSFSGYRGTGARTPAAGRRTTLAPRCTTGWPPPSRTGRTASARASRPRRSGHGRSRQRTP